MQNSRKIGYRNFLRYKFINSLFLGLSVGSIFILYTPLEPSIYSLGGILLALAMLVLAKLYKTILTIDYFYYISVLVEITMMTLIVYFLVFSYSYMSALLIYIGYQITFVFGSYLVRAETLFLKKTFLLSRLDVLKQVGYLVGMGVSYVFYKMLEYYDITNKQIQVYDLHFLLLGTQFFVFYFLVQAFPKK